MKKILALVLALAMILMVAVASANTITVGGAVKGETYNIYKMLDLEHDETASPNTALTYTINADWEDFWTGSGAGAAYIDTNTIKEKTYVVWKKGKDTAAEMEAFAKAAAKFAADNSKSPAAAAITAGDGPVTFTVGDGYYLVTSTLGIAATVFSTPANTTQEIIEKNETDNTDKVVKEDSTGEYGKTNDAQVGDEIEFRAVVNIAKNSINVKYHDTMDSQLDWTGTSKVAVFTDEACTTALDAANWSVAAGTAPETFVVTFTDEYVATLTAATTPLYITYTATLNDSALITDDIHNTPSVTWGDHGKQDGQPTTTKTYKFILNKVDGGTDKLIAGAKFQLFLAEEGGTAIALAKNGDGTVYRIYNGETSKLPSGFTPVDDATIVTLDSVKIDIVGVDAQDYWLEETEAPLGYTKIEGRTKVTPDSTNAVESKIVNNSGTTLPSTGGIGTTIFYILGGLLVVGAAVILVARRKAQD